MSSNRKDRRRGSALIEFSLCSVVWIPLLMGTIYIGINVTRSIQVTQICRDAAHMHASGVDFSLDANKTLLLNLSKGFNITAGGGEGVYVLSTVMQVGPEQCEAGGLKANSQSCPNLTRTVFTRRLTIGNKALRASTYGTPLLRFIDAGGNVSSTGYLTDSSMRVANFPAALMPSEGSNAYIAEVYFSSSDLDWSTFSSGQGVYSSFIF